MANALRHRSNPRSTASLPARRRKARISHLLLVIAVGTVEVDTSANAQSAGEAFLDALRHNFWARLRGGEASSVFLFVDGDSDNELSGTPIVMKERGERGFTVGAKQIEAMDDNGTPRMKINLRLPIDPFRENCPTVWSTWETVRNLKMSKGRSKITYEWLQETIDERSCEVTDSRWINSEMVRWPELRMIEIVDAETHDPIETLWPGGTFRVRLDYADPPIGIYAIEETVTVKIADGTEMRVFVSGHSQTLLSDPITVPRTKERDRGG